MMVKKHREYSASKLNKLCFDNVLSCRPHNTWDKVGRAWRPVNS